MDIDSCAQLDSPVHAWDPRLKILALGIFILTTAAAQSVSGLLLVLTTAVGLTAMAHLPAAFVMRALRCPLAFMAVMFPVLAVSSGGDAVFSLGPVSVYREGVTLAGAMTLRAAAMMLVLVVMFGTARIHVTMQALEKLFVPPALIQILLFTYRYIFLYVRDMKALRDAARLRGFSLSKGIRRITTPASLVVVLLIRSFEQSDRVAAAMRLRGFDGTFRTRTGFRAGPADLLKSAAVAAVSALILSVEVLK